MIENMMHKSSLSVALLFVCVVAVFIIRRRPVELPAADISHWQRVAQQRDDLSRKLNLLQVTDPRVHDDLWNKLHTTSLAAA